MIHVMTRHSVWCAFLVVSFTLAQPILLHRTHINETQYLKKHKRDEPAGINNYPAISNRSYFFYCRTNIRAISHMAFLWINIGTYFYNIFFEHFFEHFLSPKMAMISFLNYILILKYMLLLWLCFIIRH